MKNLYEMYHIDNDDNDATVEEKSLARKVHRKVTAMINRIVKSAQAGTLSKKYISTEKTEFRKLPSSTGIQDTASRERVVTVMEERLAKEAGLSLSEAKEWGDKWWDA